MEESDADSGMDHFIHPINPIDSGGEEQITDQDLKEILKIHHKRRKFQKEYHRFIIFLYLKTISLLLNFLYF